LLRIEEEAPQGFRGTGGQLSEREYR